MKFISWNVNGLRACREKGFEESFAKLDADCFCLQETKLQEGQIDISFDGYESYWNYAEKKGYSGTCIFTRIKPLSVRYGLGIEEHDHEGRVITLEFEHLYLVTVYTPNSQDGLRRLDYRMTWDDDFRAYVQQLDEHKPVVICGDLNVAHQEIDLKNPKSNRKNAGFTDEELVEIVKVAHANDALVLSAIGTSQEGSSREVIEQIAIRNKVAGVDIQHIGDAGYGGLATVENIYALSVAIRGVRHTVARMARSVVR